MPHIIVTADGTGGAAEAAVMLYERLTAADLESEHFATQLIERVTWAVGDAQERERSTAEGQRLSGSVTRPTW